MKIYYFLTKVITLTFLTVMVLAASVTQAAHFNPSETDWTEHFAKFKAPHVLFDNKGAFKMRKLLLDYAPKGSEVAILSFVVENGEAVRSLAAHVCKAASRGVKVKWLTDSKSGSIPGAPNPFNQPVMEELFQYMANCGAEVRIHNFMSQFSQIAGRSIPARKYLFVKDKAQATVNRLNHRKLFWVKTPAGNSCFLLGGRNLGDHYLTWHEDSFIDADIMICNHYRKDSKYLPNGDQGNFEVVVDKSKASFDSLWNDHKNGPNGDLEWGAPVEVYTVSENPRFSFQHIYLNSRNSYGIKRPVAEFQLGKNLKNKKGKTSKEGEVPVATIRNNEPPQGSRLLLSYDWDVKTTMWNPDYDKVRQGLHDMVRREQAEIYIESAYTEYDDELKVLLKDALRRGVQVTVIANSLYTSDGPSKAISLTRAEYTNELYQGWGQNHEYDFDTFYDLPRQRYQYPNQKGKFEFYVTTSYAGHMIHFKGAGFKCQKGDDGKYYKSFILGSHNFHVRSGLSDKEHALTWKEPVDLTCVNRLGAVKAKASGVNIAQIEARYHVDKKSGGFTRIKAKYRDLIEHRLRYWSGLNRIFGGKHNRPILLSFPSLRAELAMNNEQMAHQKMTIRNISRKAFKWMADRYIYKDFDPAKFSKMKPGAKKTLNWLSPKRDFIRRFL